VAVFGSNLHCRDRRRLSGAEHECQAVQARYDQEQRPVTHHEGAVLQQSTDHRTEKVRPEGDHGGSHIFESLGENQICHEDRCERDRGGSDEPRND
jgi:hypothetical protein